MAPRISSRLSCFLGVTFLAPLAFAQPTGFPSRQQIVAELQAAEANYPSICEFVDLTARYGTPPTHLGNHIYALRISDNPTIDEDEPSFLMVAAHHGNEYGTPIVALDTIARLTQGYTVDPTITAIVDENEIWIAPLWNMDGYPTTRHNARPGGTVDLNRNYPFLWSSACNTGVKGPAPGSEPETQTMIAWSLDQRFTKVLDFHSSGRETLYAYRSGCEVHPFTAYLQSEAIAVSSASGYGGSVRTPSSNGEHYQWQLGTFSNYAFLTEISNTQSPTRASADQEAALLWPGTLFMLQRPVPVWGHVTDALSGLPIEADITVVGHPFVNGERNSSEPLFGRYHAFLPNGSYTLRFSHPNYLDRDVPVMVTANGTQLDVALSPPGITFDFPGGLPAEVDPAGGTRVLVNALPGTLVPRAGTGLFHVSSSNETRTVAMTELAPNTYEASFPGFACGDDVRYSFSVEDTQGGLWNSPPSGRHEARTTVQRRILVSDSFESSTGWVGGQPGDTATTGLWNLMDPEPTAAQPGDDHTSNGTQCWITDGRAGTSIGTYDVDNGFTTLLSPIYDLSADPEAYVSYWRWYSNDQNGQRDDTFRVDLSNDGGTTFVNVETVGPTGTQAQGGWFQHTFRVADLLPPTNLMRLRFVAEDLTPGSIVEAAVDDFEIFVPTCDGEVLRDGSGCSDSTGTALSLIHSGSVRVGEVFELGLEAGVSLPYALALGTNVNPPLPLPGTGIPGCTLYVLPVAWLSPLASGTRASLTVPQDPAIVGATVSWQAALLDPALATALPIATSDHLLTKIGS